MIVADVVFLPCKGIEEGSWMWWLKGCFMYQADTVLAVGLSVALAGVLAVALWSLRQRVAVTA